MGRRRKTGLDAVAALPWPTGVMLGIVAYLFIRYGIGWWLAGAGGPLGQGMAKPFSEGGLAPLAWVALALCWIAALVSFLRSRRRRALLDAQTGLDSFSRAGWRDFERLVGEAYRRQGYTVEETGLGGADGGIDLVLRKGGRTTLVQVKQWRRQQVDVRVVREMLGLMTHHRADAVRIAALGGFTRDAQAFASGKSIGLIDGPTLLSLVQSVQSPTARSAENAPSPSAAARPTPTQPPQDTQANPRCPRCKGAMALRKNRSTGAAFLGCSGYRSVTAHAPRRRSRNAEPDMRRNRGVRWSAHQALCRCASPCTRNAS